MSVAQTTLPRYLKALESVGIIEKVVPFGESVETSKRGIYRLSEPCYAFWFRFVMPYSSDIEAGLGQAVVNAIPEEQLNEYLGHRFEALCAEWLVEQAETGQVGQFRQRRCRRGGGRIPTNGLRMTSMF